MTAQNTRIRVLCFFAIILLTSCASVKVREISSYSARPNDCQLAVYNDVREINGAYEVACELKSITAASLFVKRTAKAAIERAKPAACRCGADAILVISSGRTAMTFFTWRRGIASVQAIRMKHTAAR